MAKKKKKQQQRHGATPQASGSPALNYFLIGGGPEGICCPGYTSLDRCPEVLTACRKIAGLIASMTIYLYSNTEKGDQRIINELSRKIDINPNSYQTRRTFIETVVLNLLLYGRGNSVVIPRTEGGILASLDPIPPAEVSFLPNGRSYYANINGIQYEPDEILHFVDNPDPNAPWRGKGLTISLRDLANNLKQAAKTEREFLANKFMPSLIIKVDALTEEFSSPDGRQKLLDDYVKNSTAGEPWLIPAEAFSVDQVKPLTLSDLAINSVIELDRRMVASILGVPPFILGAGEYNQAAWNNFVSNTIQPIAKEIEQEMTRKLILSPKWYIKFNILSLYNYDIQTTANVFCQLQDRGDVTGNEVRDRIGLSPREGLDELKILENYIPADKSGDQKKLVQGGSDGQN